jgi:hypothetical protein
VTNKGSLPSFLCKKNLDWYAWMGEVDGPSLIFFDFYVPALTPRLHWGETALQRSENITIFAICCIYTCIIGKKGFGLYHLYKSCIGEGPRRNLVAPLLVYFEMWTITPNFLLERNQLVSLNWTVNAIRIIYVASQGAIWCRTFFRYLRKPQLWTYCC